MTQWQRTFTREPPKTKAELREMLTEAVRNTQPEPKPAAEGRKRSRLDPGLQSAGQGLKDRVGRRKTIRIGDILPISSTLEITEI
jgi:hypothetical protein